MASASGAGTSAGDADPSRSTSRRRRTHAAAALSGRLLLGAACVFAVVTGLGLLITHLLAGTVVTREDAVVDRWFARHRTGTLNTATRWVTELAATRTVVVVAAVAVAGLALALRRWREPAYLALAVTGEVLIFLAVTIVVSRHRPPVAHLDPAPPTSSFPSGHTAAATALYGGSAVLAARFVTAGWQRTLVIGLGVLLPLLVGLSRLYRGMHFPTDVLGGALLSSAWLAVLVTSLLVRRARSGPARPAAERAR